MSKNTLIASAASGSVQPNQIGFNLAGNLLVPYGYFQGVGGAVTAGSATPEVALTYGTTTTINCQQGNVFGVTLTGNITTLTVNNPTNGQTINAFFQQDNTGGWTATWPGSFKWIGSTPGVLSANPNSVDLLVATYRSTANWYCYMVNYPAQLDGTSAIFAMGGSVATTYKFTFAGSVVAASTSLLGNVGSSCAAVGPSTYGIFALGSSSTTTNQFTYAGATVASSTALTNGVYCGASSGNSTLGIFPAGGFGSATTTFTYAGATVANGTALLTSGGSGYAGTGNSTEGVFSSWSTATNTYTYAGAVVASSTALTYTTFTCCAVGNGTVGIFNGSSGAYTNTISFTYSGAVVANSTSLTVSGSQGVAAGNSSVGVFTGGAGVGHTNTFTYSGATVAATTSLGSYNQYGAGASNGIIGVTI